MYVEAERLLLLAGYYDVFGSPTERRAIYAVRYDSHGASDRDPALSKPDAPRNESIPIDEIIDAQLLREYAPLSSAEDAECVGNILSSSSSLPGKDGCAIMVALYSSSAAY